MLPAYLVEQREVAVATAGRIVAATASASEVRCDVAG